MSNSLALRLVEHLDGLDAHQVGELARVELDARSAAEDDRRTGARRARALDAHAAEAPAAAVDDDRALVKVLQRQVLEEADPTLEKELNSEIWGKGVCDIWEKWVVWVEN